MTENQLRVWGINEAQVRRLSLGLMSPESARMEAEKRRVRAGLTLAETFRALDLAKQVTLTSRKR